MHRASRGRGYQDGPALEDIPQVESPMRTPWPIEINPYLFDHQMEGRCLFPAVEALITLAAAVNRNFPQADMRCLTRARFPRFLVIPPETRQVTALVDFEQGSSGPGQRQTVDTGQV